MKFHTPPQVTTRMEAAVLAKRYIWVVQGSNRGHYVAAERAEARGRMLGIASASLGAVVGTSIFATIQSSPSVGWRIAAGILVTGGAVLGALQTFLDYAKRAAAYRTSGAAYGRLRREFDNFLLEVATSSDRAQLIEDLSVLRRHIDELGEQSPLIPSRSYKAGLRQLAKPDDQKATQ